MSAPTSQLLKYADEVDVNVANQQVNLVDLESYGHRVSITVATSAMNGALSWTREIGSARPVGHFSDASGALAAALAAAMNTSYTDTDAVTDKLSFDSSALTLNSDARIRQGGQVSANDLLMAYVLYKVYGSTTAPTEDVIFNLQDAHGMLSSADYAAAIVAAFNNSEADCADASGSNEKGAVDAMFRDLLSADPLRFFDASGTQVAGLFETNADASSAGTWNLVDGDTIEVRTVFTFLNSVTLRTSSDVAQNLNPLPSQANDETVYIAAGSTLSIRLHITASDSGASVNWDGYGAFVAETFRVTAPNSTDLLIGYQPYIINNPSPETEDYDITQLNVYNGSSLLRSIVAPISNTIGRRITGLTSGTTYVISIRAVNINGEGPPTIPITVTLP